MHYNGHENMQVSDSNKVKHHPETRSSPDSYLHGTSYLGVRRVDIPTRVAFYASAMQQKMKYHRTNVVLESCSLEMRRHDCFVR